MNMNLSQCKLAYFFQIEYYLLLEYNKYCAILNKYFILIYGEIKDEKDNKNWFFNNFFRGLR